MFNATPLLRLYASLRGRHLARSDYATQQEGELRRLLGRAAGTKIGREYNFDTITTVAEFQRRVPLRTYDDFWRDYWQTSFPRLGGLTWPEEIPFFAVSSGTSSGRTKYIPCSHDMVRSNTRAGTDLLVHHLRNRPQSRLLGGKSFMLGGSTDLVEESPGIWSGDLSGIAVKTLPLWAKLRYFPPADLALMKNWEEKIAVLAERSLKEDIRMISGVPSWMLILMHHLNERRGGGEPRLARFYPNLELLVHGGVNFGPYHRQFEALLEGSHAELREVYPASEGFIAVADRGYNEGLRMNLDHGLFFEFVPLEELGSENPTRHWIDTIELDVNYALVMTTCAGLWAYVIGDTVRFIDRAPPRLLVTGRTSYYLSAFGEHIIAEEVEDAVTRAAEELGLTVTDYSVGPVYPANPAELGGHLYVIEFAERLPTPAESARFTAALDRRLCERNDDYEAHRAKGFGLKPPALRAVPAGTFAGWMKSRGKLGGQHKVPRIIMDRELFAGLQDFISR